MRIAERHLRPIDNGQLVQPGSQDRRLPHVEPRAVAGVPHSIQPRLRRELSTGQKTANRAHSALRAPGERANAELKNWRILRKIRSSPAHTSILVNAVQTPDHQRRRRVTQEVEIVQCPKKSASWVTNLFIPSLK
jgi:hypothetical protein